MDVIKEKQPETYRKLQHKRKKRRPKKEHLSFSDWEKIIKNNKGVDERKCR